MTLTEKYLEKVSASSQFSKPVILTKNVKTACKIAAAEGKLEYIKEQIKELNIIIEHSLPAFTRNSVMIIMQCFVKDRINLEAELEAIRKEQGL